ncbi:tRNA glutamyl-Q(34) synthetase GluQRS [Lutimaribacter sp. EGI FJ00015]|uniref:tRNA glutamyl-Q(34) synthetase GluQRS n=1 Tax=Lutimaribacter degradans TaxID=2945989 RepID=A0ACC5ZW96_9RHOB|nr:tRNA glutamyl-Q(34) synthetase GluQRS [Lutimaribacter sp. EGI FJ00013]MCO0613268.1 tRNA glutamyl-Q(34) synthetase GluQRS [Lutimaribacter sp. EGI FJ00015]MCO0636245.1 tRNA glutamyl-Q(34) synthetase GluQRS [Lutimaribacter sp. EGI FJ00014]
MRTRFAPSPTGPLHLGHAYSAILAHDMARAAGGQFLLRIEDIDQARAKPEWEHQIYDDLRWLGLSWDGPVMRQSERMAAYDSALDRLWRRGLLYPCTCSRRDIADALSAPQEGTSPAIGPDGPVYPGTCRPDAPTGHPARPRPKTHHLRLDIAAACLASLNDSPGAADNGSGLAFMETGAAHAGPVSTSCHAYETQVGDIVLSRRDFGTSYHLSVVLDDAAQGITHVTRGDDLFDATRIHVLLESLLGLPTPIYHHHPLIRDETGKRLAKRDDARAIARYRADGASPNDIRRMVGL